MPVDVLEHDDRIIDDKADRQRQRHQRQVVQAESEQIHHRERADQRQGQSQAGNDRCPGIAQKQEDDQNDQRQRDHHRQLDIGHRFLDRQCPVVENGQRDRGRQLVAELRQQFLDRLTDLDRVGARLPLHGHHDGPLLASLLGAEPGGRLVVLDTVGHLGDILQADRTAFAPGDDDRFIGFGAQQLAKRLDGPGMMAAIQNTGRQIDIGRLHRRLHLVDADAAGGQRRRIDLDPHCVFLRTVDHHLGDAIDHRDALADQVLPVIIQFGKRQYRTGQRQIENRIHRRIDLGVGGRGRHVGRELALGLGDRGLDILGGGIDIALHAELQGDRRAAELAGRRHRIDARNRRKRLFQWCRHGRRHGFRTAAREIGIDLNGRHVDRRQIADRQPGISQQAEKQDRQRDQRGHHRPADENRAEVHKLGCRL